MPNSTELIVAAALRYAGIMLVMERPARHHTIFFAMHKHLVSVPDAEQGFLTSAGRFVDRVTAHEIATAAGQTTSVEHKDLFTEDLW